MNTESLTKTLQEMNGKLEEIKILNETIAEYLENLENERQNDKTLCDRIYKIMFFSYMAHDKSEEVSKEVNKIIPCLQ